MVSESIGGMDTSSNIADLYNHVKNPKTVYLKKVTELSIKILALTSMLLCI